MVGTERGYLRECYDGLFALNKIDAHVGARLRAQRLRRQVSPEWLAIHLAVSVDQVLAIEEGSARIGFEDLLRAADALGVPERYFYTGLSVKTPDRKPRSKPWLRDVDYWFRDHLHPHERALLAVARRMTGNSETAKDVVQEAYADVLRDDRWRGIQNPRAYVMKAIRSLAGRLLQRARIVPIELLANMEEVEQMDLNPDAYELLSAKQRRQIILDAIEALPPQCRRVVKLRRLTEASPKDIAKEMGITVATVEQHLAKGMALIADTLGEQGPSRSRSGGTGKCNIVPRE